MRLVKRQELMTLPPGTLFAELFEPWSFGQLAIKGETWIDGDKNFDFLEIGLGAVASDSTEQYCERLGEMLADSTVSYPAESDYGREGLYDDNIVYLVYEPADVDHLIGLLRGETP